MTSSPLHASADRLSSASARVAGVVEDGCGEGAGDAADAVLLALLRAATEARAAAEVIQAQASAEIARRSGRERGHTGMAQRLGHRNAISLVQNLTGQSRADVTRSLRAGDDLLPAATERADATEETPGDASEVAEPSWHESLTAAWTSGRLTQSQYTAIRTGLGEPPIDRYPDLDPAFLPRAWLHAVDRLLDEAATLPVEELRAATRIARDRLDPIGVTLRFDERFAARSFRTWTDEHGQRHARIVFDDDAAAWIDAILNAALRPRRGPRFVAEEDVRERDDATSDVEPEENDRAADSSADDRTTEQLRYDTLVAILRTGAAADPAQAFGDRQPGVRVIVDADVLRPGQPGGTRVDGMGHLEDGGHSLPGAVVETYLCDAGTISVSVDPRTSRPLDVGREHRLFTRKQRIAIGIRDGGCIGEHCTAPLSHCEMHHIDHWWEDHGRTDVDDGVALCRNCHLRLHNQRARISRRRDPRTGLDTYFWHAPPDPDTGRSPAPTALRSRSPRRFDAA